MVTIASACSPLRDGVLDDLASGRGIGSEVTPTPASASEGLRMLTAGHADNLKPLERLPNSTRGAGRDERGIPRFWPCGESIYQVRNRRRSVSRSAGAIDSAGSLPNTPIVRRICST